MKKPLLAALTVSLLAMVLISQSKADPEFLIDSQTGTNNSLAATWTGQPFYTPNYSIQVSRVVVWMYAPSAVQFTANIRAAAADGKPTGANLLTSNTTTYNFGGYNDAEFSFSDNVWLSASTRYTIVIQIVTSAGRWQKYNINVNSSYTCSYSSDGAAWALRTSGYAMRFFVYGHSNATLLTFHVQGGTLYVNNDLMADSGTLYRIEGWTLDLKGLCNHGFSFDNYTFNAGYNESNPYTYSVPASADDIYCYMTNHTQQDYDTGWADGNATGYTNGWNDGNATGYANGWTAGNATGYINGWNDGNATGYANGWNDGNATGYTNGWNTGNSTGYTNGYNAGYALGLSTGYDEGWIDGNATGYAAGYEAGLAEAAPEDYITIQQGNNNVLLAGLLTGTLCFTGFVVYVKRGN